MKLPHLCIKFGKLEVGLPFIISSIVLLKLTLDKEISIMQDIISSSGLQTLKSHYHNHKCFFKAVNFNVKHDNLATRTEIEQLKRQG